MILRGIAIFCAVSIALFASLAISVPFFVEGQAARGSLKRNLSTWSGGAVKINGDIHVASLFALTIEAAEVEIAGTAKIDPVTQIRAQSVKAIVSFPSLLAGRLEFSKVILIGPRLVFKRESADGGEKDDFGVNGLMLAAKLAGRGRLNELVLRNATIFSPNGPRQPYQAIHLPYLRLVGLQQGGVSIEAQVKKPDRRVQLQMRLGRESEGRAPLSIWARDPSLEVAFKGELNFPENSAAGQINAKLAASEPNTRRWVSAIFPWEAGQDVALAGEFSWTQSRLALDDATIRFGDRSAKGSIAIGRMKDRLLLEATLAQDSVDFTPFVAMSAAASADRPLVSDLLASLDLDVRLSTERIRAGELSAGPLALAVVAQQGRISADVAELGLFNGTWSGRVDYNPLSSQSVALRFAGHRVDSAALMKSFAFPELLSGDAEILLTLSGTLSGFQMKSAEGSFSLGLPLGGTLDGEAFERLEDALRRNQVLPAITGSARLPLTRLLIDGSFNGAGATATIEGGNSSATLGGSLRLELPGGALDGALTVSDGEAPQLADTAPREQPSTKVQVSGTPTDPIFIVKGRAGLSN